MTRKKDELTDGDMFAQLPPALQKYIQHCRDTDVDDAELAAEIEYLDLDALPTPAPDGTGAMPHDVLRAYRRLLDSGERQLADAYMGRYSAAEGKPRHGDDESATADVADGGSRGRN